MEYSKVNQELNLEPAFDSLVEYNLGSYVYVLVDPKDKIPFYIGKGGASGAGNNRLLHHFEEARESAFSKSNHSKIQKIHENPKIHENRRNPKLSTTGGPRIKLLLI